MFIVGLCVIFFLFFKQKTAYEMRISDWSSDVCSSDLPGGATEKSAHTSDTGGHPRRTLWRHGARVEPAACRHSQQCPGRAAIAREESSRPGRDSRHYYRHRVGRPAGRRGHPATALVAEAG